MFYLSNFSVLLNGMVQKEPGYIVGPVTKFLGFFLNIIFNAVYSITEPHSLGISIIFLTIFSRLIVFPLSVKSHKSTYEMQKIQPEIEKIKKKYEKLKDPESQRKMQQETQVLYSKSGINPLGGCLPLLIQFPIFFALTYIMRQPYMFIDKLREIYVDGLATNLMNIDGIFKTLAPIATTKLPSNGSIALNISSSAGDLAKVLNAFSPEDWSTVIQNIPANFSDKAETITGLLNEVKNINSFLGLSLTDIPFNFSETSLFVKSLFDSNIVRPSINFFAWLIPIISTLVSYFSMKIVSKQQTANSDPAMASQQKMMSVTMPLMSGFLTLSAPIGVGIYWITSSAMQIVQQVLMNKIYSGKKGD